ncbi:MAG: hypothetical protein R3B99_12405 [Polyangiales bacterium]
MDGPRAARRRTPLDARTRPSPRRGCTAKPFVAAGLADRVTVVVGDAVEELANLEAHGPFCAVFVDADKERYDRYGAWAAENLRPGGLLDRRQRLLLRTNFRGRGRRGGDAWLHEATPAAFFDSVCMPTPDGLLVGIRR